MKEYQQKQYRTLSLDRSMVNEENESIELSFSSEEPVERMWGLEILSHEPDAVDLSRLNDGGALLLNHDPYDQIGVVESARIDPDKKARAVVRFSKSTRAREIYRDVIDGIRKKISVGYIIKKADELMEDGKRIFRAVQWEPLEVSIVSIPADTTVGVGRSVENTNAIITGDTIMADKNQTPATNAGANEPERQRSAEILALMNQYVTRVNGLADAAQLAINDGWPVDRFKAEILAKLDSRPIQTDNTIGMSEKEVRQYSLRNAIMSQVHGSGFGSGLEVEASRAVADRLGYGPKGLFIPDDVLISKRTLAVAPDSAGGYLKGTQHLASSFIELLRNKMLVNRLGVQFLSGLVGDVAIPKQGGAGTVYWVAEGSDLTTSDQTFTQLTMTPKTLGAFTDMSRKLLLQSSPSVDQLVANDLTSIIAIAADRSVFHGAGTDEPTGIANTPNVGAVAGASLNWAKVVEFETDVATANADVATMAYVTNPAVGGILKTREQNSGTGIYLASGGQMNGYPVHITNQIASGFMFFGDFSQVIIGEWGALDLLVDPFTGIKSGALRIRVFKSMDVGVRHPGAFAVGTSIS